LFQGRLFGATLSPVQGQQNKSTRPGGRARDRRPSQDALIRQKIGEDGDPNGKQDEREQFGGIDGCWPDVIQGHFLNASS
jgi:hypothetical protein